MKELQSEIFIKILGGEYKNIDSDYKFFYRKSEYSDETEIFIHNVKIVGEIKVSSTLIIEDLVKIENCVFQNQLILNKMVFKKHLGLILNVFNDMVAFYGKEFNSVSIYKSRFKKSLHFGGGNYLSVRIGNIISESVDVLGGFYISSFSIDGENIDRFLVANSDTFINVLGLSNNLRNTNISLQNFKLNRLYLAGQYESSNIIAIENLELHSINFDMLRNKGDINFNNIKINKKELEVSKITIEDFFNKNNISSDERVKIQSYSTKLINESAPLTELHLAINDKYSQKRITDIFIEKEDSKNGFFEMKKVQIGNMQFKNFPLEQFQDIRVIDTELISLKTFNSTFPLKRIRGNHRSLYEIFNDLYTVANTKNNRLEATEYYKAAQNSLLLSLLKIKWWKNIPSIISLSISKLYSNFGTRWTQAFFLVIPLVSIICFSIMLFCSNYDIEFSKEGLDGFISSAIFYIQYLNPAHRIDFMDNKLSNYMYSMNLGFMVFDFIGRILISIGIFETIKSFRKYVR